MKRPSGVSSPEVRRDRSRQLAGARAACRAGQTYAADDARPPPDRQRLRSGAGGRLAGCLDLGDLHFHRLRLSRTARRGQRPSGKPDPAACRRRADGARGGVGMVTNILNYGRSGVADWVVQRFSALILAAYTVVMVSWLAVNGGDLTFAQWQGFMGQTWVRIFTLLTVLAFAGHAWIGLWTVATDYMKKGVVRVAFLGGVASSLFVYVVWGISILWAF